MTHDLLTGTTLRERAAKAVADDHLQGALQAATDRFSRGCDSAAGAVSNYEELRAAARYIRADVLSRLPDILGELADKLEARGGHVCWAATADEANAYVADVMRRRNAKLVVKGKSMASEEIHLNDMLERMGVEPVETDLGEWIIQLADETPSHIIAPAIHKTRYDVADL